MEKPLLIYESSKNVEKRIVKILNEIMKRKINNVLAVSQVELAIIS